MLYAFTKKYPAIITLTTNLRKLHVTNHTNDHRADLSAWLWFLPAYFSQRYAHKNGQPINHNNPNGPRTIPNRGSIRTATTNQILLPRTPRLVQPNFFVPRDGMI
jgi:hypothetical protein